MDSGPLLIPFFPAQRSVPDVPVRIISRPEHPISRKNIDPDALKVLYRLRQHGFLAYLVGGSVRDLFLGRQPKDFDVATDARPSEIKEVFRNSRVIGQRFRLVQVFFRGGKVIEVSTFRCRSEFEQAGGILASNNTFGTPAEDAWRRDLTINALFYDVSNFSVVDYVGGVEDLRQGIVRVVGDPDVRFLRDPVRMMRAIRHAARTGFAIEEKTRHAIEKNRNLIGLCPVSRVRDEWLRDFTTGNSARCVELMIKTGFLFSLFPFYERVVEEGEGECVPFFLKLLEDMDRLQREDAPPDEGLRFAIFLLPWFHCSGLAWSPSPETPAPWFTEAIRDGVHEALGTLDIKRSVRENTAHLLAAQPVLSEMAAAGKLLPRLRPRRYAPEAIRLFLMAAEAQRKTIPSSTLRLFYRAARRSRREIPRRRHKKGRPEPQPSP